WLALDVEELLRDCVEVLIELGGECLEAFCQLSIVGLLSQLFCPERCEVQVGTAVVDFLDLAGRGVAFGQQTLGCVIECSSKNASALVTVVLLLVAEGLSQSQELTEGVPTQVVFFLNLLNVLRSRATSTGLKQTAASHQRNNREHLCGSAKFQNWEQVGVVVTQNVTGDRDGVLATTDALNGNLGCLDWGKDLNVQALGVVVAQVLVDQVDEVAVVCTLRVEPEDGLHAGQACAVNSKLDPVLDWGILGLACAPDVICLNVVGSQNISSGVNKLDFAVSWDLESLVVGAVLLSLLSHQTNVRGSTHGGWVVSAVFAAVFDNSLVNASVRGIRDDSEGVLLFIVLVPHVAGGTDHRRHGSVDDDIRRNVQVGNTLVGVNHC